MGAVDTETKRYLKDSRRFADAFNGYFFDGRQVVRPENLQELDATELVSNAGRKHMKSLQKYRDVLKLYAAKEEKDGRGAYIILGVEAQTNVHYAMPVRAMLYDAMQYSAQIQRRAQELREVKALKGRGEFLSGFQKGDRLCPVLTLVVSFSPEEWDGPLALRDMMDVSSKEFLPFLPDYRLNLLSPAQLEEKDFDKFVTGLGSVLKFVKHSDDDNFDWLLQDRRFESIDMESAQLIQTVTGTKFEFEEEGEAVNMCKAWENVCKKWEISMKESYNSGNSDGLQKGIYSTVLNVAKNLHLSPEEALAASGVKKKDWGPYLGRLQKALGKA